MKLTADEQQLLRAIGSLAEKLLGNKQRSTRRGGTHPRRIVRSRAESAKLKKDILAAVRKGTAVAEISETFNVTAPYVYQLMSKAGAKRRKRA